MVLETCMALCVTDPEKFFLPPELEKWTKNGSETGFFEFIEIFGH